MKTCKIAIINEYKKKINCCENKIMKIKKHRTLLKENELKNNSKKYAIQMSISRFI